MTSDLLNTISLISSIASLVLAIVAIALSIVFYVLARDQSEKSAKNAEEIASSVSRLEKVFDGLYNDTFSMMKETVTDMRQQIWHRIDPSLASTKIEEPQAERGVDPVLAKLEEFSSQLGIADDKIEKLSAALRPVVEESTSEPMDDDDPPLRSRVQRLLMRRLHTKRPGLTIGELTKHLSAVGSVNSNELIDVIFDLRAKGIITWSGDSTSLSSSNRIEYVPAADRPERA